MEKNIGLEEITLDEHNSPVVYVVKKLKNSEILKVGKICCYDWPSFTLGLEKYISKHSGEWNLKNNETIGFLMKGRHGYHYNGRTFKTVVFYRIKDRL